jgi:O-antigen ligase
MSILTGAARHSVAVAASLLAAFGLFLGGAGSPNLPLLIVAAAALLAGMACFGLPQRRFLIGMLFLAAPFDVSKAFIAPLEQFYSPGLYVTIGEGTAVALGLVWALQRLFVQRLRLPFTRLDGCAFGFLALVWLGALHSRAGLLAYASAGSYSLSVLAYYVVSHAMQSKDDVRLAVKMACTGLCIESIYVTAQMATQSFLTLPGAKVAPVGAQGLLYEAEQIAAFRPIGSFDHPNALADYLTLLLPCALGLVLVGRTRLPPRIYYVALLVLVAATALLLLTLSRGGWAAASLGALFVGAVCWRKNIIGSGHLLALAAALLATLIAAVAIFPQIVLRLTEPDGRSLESRLVLTDQALTIIDAHPLIGVGFGGYNRAAFEHIPPSFALISADYQKQLLQLIVHNHYLLLATELGVPAMVYWVFLMLRFIRQAWPLSRWQDPGMFGLGIGLAGALASQMLFLASDNYYTDIRVFLLWLTAGVLQALTLIADADGTRPDAHGTRPDAHGTRRGVHGSPA